MSHRWVRLPKRYIRRAAVTLLALGVVDASVPARAGPPPDSAPSTVAADLAAPRPALFLTDEASRHIREAFEHSSAVEGRRLDLTTQSSSIEKGSRVWCSTGLVLLAGGITAAI